MSQGTFELTAGDVFELTSLNRALAHFARPAPSEDWLAPIAPDERKQLIERLWSRKRQLLRQAEKSDGWGPEPPVA